MQILISVLRTSNYLVSTQSQTNAGPTSLNYSFNMNFNPSIYDYVFQVVSPLQVYNPHIRNYMETTV